MTIAKDLQAVSKELMERKGTGTYCLTSSASDLHAIYVKKNRECKNVENPKIENK